MIARDYITEWRAHAPWVQDIQVEQDLVICRALTTSSPIRFCSPRWHAVEAHGFAETAVVLDIDDLVSLGSPVAGQGSRVAQSPET